MKRKVSKLVSAHKTIIMYLVTHTFSRCVLTSTYHVPDAVVVPTRVWQWWEKQTWSLPLSSILSRGEKCRYAKPRKMENGIWKHSLKENKGRFTGQNAADRVVKWDEAASWMPLNHHSSIHTREWEAVHWWTWHKNDWTGNKVWAAPVRTKGAWGGDQNSPRVSG